MIKLTLRVKFRAFGFTFGTIERVIPVNLNVPFVPPISTVLCDERGVYLKIEA
jgi:hypothetical protein